MSDNVTDLLLRWREGERSALDALVPLVYDELHRIADAHMRRERDPASLQPTALVHEAFIKLTAGADVDWRDRSHFLAVAARMMRQVLVDRGRRQHARKRDGGERVTLTSLDGGESPRDIDLLALDQAMQRLADIDARRAQIVELRVFGGLDFSEIGEVMQLSRATLDREFRTARLWLFHAISVDGAASS